MNKLQIFKNNDFGEIRTILVDNQPFIASTDTAKVLGYKNPHDAIMRHCRWVVKHEVPHPQNPDRALKVNFIPEGDIYRLIINSELPSAEKFESWVFDEVLPSIRKSGGYIANQENLSPEEIVANALIVAQNIIKEKNKLLTEQKPKVLFAEAVTVSKTSILVGELAKLIKQNGVNIGQNRLFEWLRDKGYLCKSGENYNLPTQYSMELGLFEIKKTVTQNPDGSSRVNRTPKVTGKGQVYFVNKFLVGRTVSKEVSRWKIKNTKAF